uniref:Uncharacterized protein n=1 Tax=Myotis myotis TaxID=51298 RepID=A0A7J7Z6A0_MYOMY|nr:hypothetical protein mMyoMyo1_010798 [Myotis myotis]
MGTGDSFVDKKVLWKREDRTTWGSRVGAVLRASSCHPINFSPQHQAPLGSLPTLQRGRLRCGEEGAASSWSPGALTVPLGQPVTPATPDVRSVRPRRGPCSLVLSSQKRWAGLGVPWPRPTVGAGRHWGSNPSASSGLWDSGQAAAPPAHEGGGCWVSGVPTHRDGRFLDRWCLVTKLPQTPQGLSPRQISAWPTQQLPATSAEPASRGSTAGVETGVCKLNSAGLKDCGALITFQNFPFVSRLALRSRAPVCVCVCVSAQLLSPRCPPFPVPGPPPSGFPSSPGAGPGQGQRLCFSYLRVGGL